MLKKEIIEILSSSKSTGWVLEPEAKQLLSLNGINTPRFIWAKRVDEAIGFAEEIGYPVVAKVISPKVLHKSEKMGVTTDINSREKLVRTFNQFSKIDGFVGTLVEERISGIELIIGMKVDYQFGPVILFGIGGIWTEIYQDIILRMAPLSQWDIESMIRCLKARPLLQGYRGTSSVNLIELEKLLVTFSDLVINLEEFVESIDLNPVICSSTQCVVADARIILKNE